MADVFISYAREDKDFVRSLFDALDADGRDTWVDWKDIPPTVDWLEEIYAAIESADTFVFVISPCSVTSETCNKEIAHALKHNKRLVPIIRHEIDEVATFESLEGCDWEAAAHDNWEALRRLNWIFFRESEDFDSAFQALLEILDTDLEWVKAHTRLLVRATEWDSEERDNSFLLRGKDLKDAEQWLSQAGLEKEPRSTSLQTQYVIASRQNASGRQRRIFGAVTIGLFVAIALALFAFNQSRIAGRETNSRATQQAIAEAEADARATQQAIAEAEADARATQQAIAEAEADARATEVVVRSTAEAEAIQSAQIARSRQFAVQSASELSKNHYESALLLAIESGRITDTLEAFGALREALAHPWRTRRVFYGHTDTVRQASWSGDESRILTASEDGTARVWDAESGRELARLEGHTDTVRQATWSGDESRILTLSEDGTVGTWFDRMEDLIDAACRQAPRNMTWAEWRRTIGDEAYRPTCEGAPVPPDVIEVIVSQARNLAQQGQVEEAEAALENALSLDPEARQISSQSLVNQGRTLARQGEVEAAVAAFEDAQDIDPELEISAFDWNTLCWFGSLYGQAAEVEYACEQAVALDPDHGGIRDSRGVNRALLGEVDGAIEDFEAFVAFYQDDDPYKEYVSKRKAWIEALRTGENPFDEETLAALREE
jgi:tetratricopeptide (TPR) repeat protein